MSDNIQWRAPKNRAKRHFYRAYHFDKKGAIVRVHIFEARSDENAVKYAQSLVERCAVEVWDEGQRIERIEPFGD